MSSVNEAEGEGQGAGERSVVPEPAVCSACGEAIAGVFFRVSGQVVCTGCRERWIAEREAGTPAGRFGRALALGAGAAVLSAVAWYWIARLTDREFGLIAILVGLLVGGAVKLGSRKRGGWGYQGLAMFLTYTAIVSSYIPAILEAAQAWDDEAAVVAAAADQPEAELAAAEQAPADQPVGGAFEGRAAGLASDDGAAAAPGAEGLLSAGEVPSPVAGEEGAALGTPAVLVEEGSMVGGVAGLALAILLIFGLAFAAPFLAGFENFLGWLILGIALYQAWTLNRREVLEFEGPFRTSGSSTYVPETPPQPIAP